MGHWVKGFLYEGERDDGFKPHGKGKLISYLGGMYEGDFVHAIRHGKGKQTYSRGFTYEGDWKDGRLNGHGKSTTTEGDCYNGEFVDGKKHGKGIFTWSDGDSYDGYWKDDKRHGKGKWRYGNGDEFEGVWNEGKRHETGTMTRSSGARFHQVYRDGELVSEKQCATLTNAPPLLLSPRETADAVLLADEHKTCVICFEAFTTDTNSTDEKVRRHLPVLSKKCDHWYCHGCILESQAAKARRSNGEVPNRIQCLGSCTTKNAFCPSEPNYHRMLIDLLQRSITVMGGE